MATSVLTLYEKCELTPEHNYIIDDFATYLNSLTKTVINDFQYVKHNLDIELKVSLPQTQANNPLFNYIKIKNSDDSRTFYYFIINAEWRATNTVLLKLSMDTLTTFTDKLSYSNWSNQTKVIRQHEDRFTAANFSDTNAFTGIRKIDRHDEGINNLLQYKTSEDYIKKSDEQTEVDTETTNNKRDYWYLIYTSDEDEGIGCYLTRTTQFKEIHSIGPYHGVVRPTEDLEIGEMYVLEWHNGDNPSFTCKPSYASEFTITPTNEYAYVLCYGVLHAGDPLRWRLFQINLTNQTIGNVWDFQSSDDYLDFPQTFNVLCEKAPVNSISAVAYNIADYSSIYTIFNLGNSEWPQSVWPLYDVPVFTKAFAWYYSEYMIDGLAEWDRTNSKLIKIIQCPYAPIFDVFHAVDRGWVRQIKPFGLNGTDISVVKLKDLDTTFKNEITLLKKLNYFEQTIPAKAARFNASKNMAYESKLYNSDFFNDKYTYDSFSYIVRPELIDVNLYAPAFNIYYYQSSNLSSKLYFDFKIECSNPVPLETPNVTTVEDFQNVMICNRNNEYPIYNNEYINYIKNGYNYDIKNKNTQNAQNWLMTGIQIAGGVAGLAASTVTGGVSAAAGISLLTSATASAARNITNTANAEKDLQQKLATLKSQSASVAEADDLSLFDSYGRNRLSHFTYEISSDVKSEIYKLFYRTGYAVNRIAGWSTTSRRCFNYLQCEPVFKNEEDADWLKYIKDIKARYQAGVTVMHKFQTNNTGTYKYDFNFEYENWETWICPRTW